MPTPDEIAIAEIEREMASAQAVEGVTRTWDDHVVYYDIQPGGAVGKEAATALIGKPLADAQIQAAAEAAYIKARPLDNTDFVYQWRKQMARQYTLRALRDLQS